MGYLKDFIIPFNGLGIGNHEFTFKVNNKFFEEIEYSVIKKGEIHVFLNLEKQDNMLILNFKLHGLTTVECDRCLDEFELAIQNQFRLIIKFGEEYMEESDEIIVLPEKQHQIDITPFIYEYINISLPIQRMHPEDKKGNSLCNPEVIKKLNEYHESDESDPRWDALKKLKDNL